MDLQRLVDSSARAVEIVGILTIIVGAVVAVALVLWRSRGDPREWYKLYRRYFGHSLLLGLEFLVAADIIRTVSHVPTFDNVVVLGLVVLIRTFLSFTVGVELEGHWPWQKAHMELREARIELREAQLKLRDRPPA